MAGQAGRPGRDGARPEDRAADRRDRPGHLDRDLRVGPAPVRGARAVPHPRRRARPRADGHRRGGRPRGHPPQGRATGSSSRSTSPAARCWMCSRGLYAQCETTQVREQGKGAALFGYTSLYGAVPGGQAEYLRVPAGPLRPDQGAGRARRRALPLPLRHPAHRLAGRRLRRRARAAARSPSSGSDRSASSAPGSAGTRAPSASSASTWCPSGWPWPRAHGDRDARHERGRRRRRRRCSSSPAAAARTP